MISACKGLVLKPRLASTCMGGISALAATTAVSGKGSQTKLPETSNISAVANSLVLILNQNHRTLTLNKCGMPRTAPPLAHSL